MNRTLLSLACILLIAGTNVAQGKADQPQIKSATENDELVWTLPEEGVFPYDKLLDQYAQDRALVIMYQRRHLGRGFQIEAARAGTILRGNDIDLFVADALEQHRFALLPNATGWHVAPVVEAVSHAPAISDAQLAAANPAHWVSVRLTLRHADSNTITAKLRNDVSRQGGMVQPLQGSSQLLVCDRVDRLRALAENVRKLDNAEKPEYRRYLLREGVDGNAAIKSLRETFKGKPVTITLSPNGHIVARASGALQAEVNSAVLALE